MIHWKGIPMLRNHSINACVHEIIEYNKKRQFLKINLIGMTGSGKTTLSMVLAHQIHSKSEVPFEVKFFKKEDLVNFKATVQGLSKNNQILIFDDLSGLESDYGKKAVERLKSEITTIRHINDQENRKIIMMLSFHAQKMLDKFLRISNMTFYVDCQLEEIGYLEELLGKKELPKIQSFQKLRAQAGLQHKFVYPLGRRKSFIYLEQAPFLPLLYNNGLTTRHIVSPTLEWILGDEICQVCNPVIQSLDTKLNLEDFKKDIDKKFGKGITKRAIELKLLQVGINTQPKRVLQAQEYIERFLSRKEVNLEELSLAYNLKPNKAHLLPAKQPEFREDLDQKVEQQIGDVLEFDIGGLKLLAKEKPIRGNWTEPFWKQSKQANHDTYADLYRLYKNKEDPETARKIKALYNVIKQRK